MSERVDARCESCEVVDGLLDELLSESFGVQALREEFWRIVRSEGEHRGLKVIWSRLHELRECGEALRSEPS